MTAGLWGTRGGQTCLLLRRASSAMTDVKVTPSPLRAPQQRSTARSCSGGCGSTTGATPAGRAGWLCRLYRHLAGSLRRGRAPRRRALRAPAAGSRVSTRGAGTATRLPAQLRPRLLVRKLGQRSCRTGTHPRQVRCVHLVCLLCLKPGHELWRGRLKSTALWKQDYTLRGLSAPLQFL